MSRKPGNGRKIFLSGGMRRRGGGFGVHRRPGRNSLAVPKPAS
jgi:hypothetical protein